MGRQSWKNPPEMEIDSQKSYTAVVKTSEGDMTLELFARDAPKTVNNFVFLARQGYYSNVIFHRVINGFMIQTGDPTGTGTGGPGYKFADEPVRRKYTKGIVAMANAGPNTNGSQFFIVHGASAPLPPNYTIFGEVKDGLEVVDAIATAPTKPGGEGSKPQNPAKIESVEIREA
jgi:cyclophilin family peptidyl-prolyl cis-trans isomerase